jgi:hypothetical protein
VRESFPEESLPALHGITSRATGIEKAETARLQMIAFVARALPAELDFDVPRMTMLSLLTRSQAFHDGALSAVREDNPFAAFTLLRSYAENAAVLIWLQHHKDDLRRLYPEAGKQQRLSIGRVVAKASTRMSGFAGIYEQLSNFAHPASTTALSGWTTTEDVTRVTWASHPAFRNEDDAMLACVWLVELAQANAHLWRECWEMYFGEDAKFTPSPWETKVAR